MSPHKTLLGLASIAGLLLSASLALADDVPPAPKPRREFCQQNPEKCEQIKRKRAERRAFCEQNPETCQEQRAQMKQHRAEMKIECANDPARCEKMKWEMRERFQERHGAGSKPAE